MLKLLLMSGRGPDPVAAARPTRWNDQISRFVIEKEPVGLRIGDSSRNILLTSRIQVH